MELPEWIFWPKIKKNDGIRFKYWNLEEEEENVNIYCDKIEIELQFPFGHYSRAATT